MCACVCLCVSVRVRVCTCGFKMNYEMTYYHIIIHTTRFAIYYVEILIYLYILFILLTNGYELG